MTDRKKSGVAFWTTAALVVVLLAYPLSLFPIRMLEKRGILPTQDSAAGAILWGYCAPARWLVRNGPEWIYNPLWWALGD
jgi:hypothetical protein